MPRHVRAQPRAVFSRSSRSEPQGVVSISLAAQGSHDVSTPRAGQRQRHRYRARLRLPTFRTVLRGLSQTFRRTALANAAIFPTTALDIRQGGGFRFSRADLATDDWEWFAISASGRGSG